MSRMLIMVDNTGFRVAYYVISYSLVPAPPATEQCIDDVLIEDGPR